MATKKKSGWKRFTSTVARDGSFGRLFLPAKVLAHATSPLGRFFACCVALPPTEQKQVDEVTRASVYELGDDCRARLVFELDVRTDLVAVSDEGVLAYRLPNRTLVIHHPDGTQLSLAEHFFMQFDATGTLLANARIDDQMVLVRLDAKTGEVKRRDPFDAGNMPFHVLTNGDVAGYGGWLSPDGVLTPMGREWTNPTACGTGLMFARAPDVEGESVWVDRTGLTKRYPDAFWATSPDGRFGISVRYPPVAEAHAQGLSPYQARIIERVDLETGARHPLHSIEFPEALLCAWHQHQLTLVRQRVVVRYDLERDEVLTPRPLETVAVRGDASAHEDGVRVGEAFAKLPRVQDLKASPTGRFFMATTHRGHVVFDRSCATVLEFPPAAVLTFCGDAHVLVGPEGNLVDLASGQSHPLPLGGMKGAATLADGVAVFFDKKIELRAIDGSVRATWPLKTKAPKHFSPDGITQAFSLGDGALLLLSRQALFRCDATGITTALAPVAKTLGSTSPFRMAAPQGEHVAVSVFSANESWSAVLVCTLAGDIVGWTGGLFEAPVGLSWSGDDLLVTDRSGTTLQYRIT